MEKISLDTPTLIFCAGRPASGKTTYSRELTKFVHDSVYICKDTINEAFLHTDESLISVDSHHYNKYIKNQSYRCFRGLAKDNLQLGKHPIVDCPFSSLGSYDYLKQILIPFFDEVNHKMKIVWHYL